MLYKSLEKDAVSKLSILNNDKDVIYIADQDKQFKNAYVK